MITDTELYDEWQQEMIDEARQDELFEKHMRNDFDYFLEQSEDYITPINEAIAKFNKYLEHYGWELPTDDLFNLIKELQ
jgi:hypothetical protein